MTELLLPEQVSGRRIIGRAAASLAGGQRIESLLSCVFQLCYAILRFLLQASGAVCVASLNR